jgi:hypothetical protein
MTSLLPPYFIRALFWAGMGRPIRAALCFQFIDPSLYYLFSPGILIIELIMYCFFTARVYEEGLVCQLHFEHKTWGTVSVTMEGSSYQSSPSASILTSTTYS